MDLNPLHAASRAARSLGSLGGTLKAKAQETAKEAQKKGDWLTLNAKALTSAASPQEIASRVHALLSDPPQDVPSRMTEPHVQPLYEPARDVDTRPQDLVPGPQPLTAKNPGMRLPVHLAQAGEGQLTLTAAAPGTDWGRKGRESATVSIFVDGKHNQDVVLYGGAVPMTYPVALGPLSAGDHAITLAYNAKASTPGATGVTVSGTQVALSGNDPQGLAEKYQPFFYGRGKGTENTHTDVPLMMWAQTEQKGADTVIHYSVIHSNEDGGTAANPALEQATWGRMTDPDPICQVTLGPDGALKGVTYEGGGDGTYNFHGQFDGTHPVLRVSTDNNNYDEHGSSPLLFKPRVKLASFPGSSREDLMDQNPWMYRISNEELRREGKVMSDAEAAQVLARQDQPGFQRPRKVEDLRHYLYVQYATSQGGHPLAVEVKLKGQDGWYRSDLGDRDLDIGQKSIPEQLNHHFYTGAVQSLLEKVGISFDERSGTGLRTTVPLPPGTKPEDVEDVRFVNHGSMPAPFSGVEKVFMLGEDYQPRYFKSEARPEVLRPGVPTSVPVQP